MQHRIGEQSKFQKRDGIWRRTLKLSLLEEKAQSSKPLRTKWEMAGKDQHSTCHRWLFLLMWKDRTWSRVLSHLSISVSIPATRVTDHMYNRTSFKSKSRGAGQIRGAQRNKTLKQKLDYSMLSTRVFLWALEGRSLWRALHIDKHSACHELRQFEWLFLKCEWWSHWALQLIQKWWNDRLHQILSLFSGR